MAEINSQQSELLLTREQLKELDHFQSRIVYLERELASCGDEFLSILNRHYFNRENGFLEDQQANLREVVVLQSKIEKLAGKLAACSSELKSFMMNLQNTLQGQISPQQDDTHESGPEKEKAVREIKEEKKVKDAAEVKDAPQPKGKAAKSSAQAGSAAAVSNPVVARKAETLLDKSAKGGEISLKLLFEELRLAEPQKKEIFNEISASLRKLLYDRQLVGYSKTSLAFSKDKTLSELLEIIKPIFLYGALLDLLIERNLISKEEKERLELACDKNRELIYFVPQ